MTAAPARWRSPGGAHVGAAWPWVGSLAITIITVFMTVSASDDGLGAASFAPGLGLCSWMLLKDAVRRPFSLYSAHALFFFMFFSTFPMIQFASVGFPMSEFFPRSIVTADVVTTNGALLLWLAAFQLAYARGSHPGAWLSKVVSRQFSRPTVVAGVAASLAALAYLAALGTTGMYTRGAYESEVRFDSTTTFLVTTIFIRGLPVVTLGLLLVYARSVARAERLVIYVIALALGVGVALIANPLAAARYFTGTVLIAFLAITILRLQRTGYPWLGTVLGGMLVLLPALDLLRFAVSFSEVTWTFADSVLHLARSGDADAYAQVLYTLKYLETEAPEWGGQFLGVLGFWIPRAWWPGKPMGSGILVARHFQFPNENIASPLPAEGLINFGWLGIVLLAVVFARLLRVLDDTYASVAAPESTGARLIDVIYPFWLGLVFFISRGDLMSSVAYTLGITACVMLISVDVEWLYPGFGSRRSR
jgi:hypothetical protein